MKDFFWQTLDLSITKRLIVELSDKAYHGCDISPVNLFLYSQKYNTKICVKDNCLFRKYRENDFIYYGFPVFLKNSFNKIDLEEAFLFIKNDAKIDNIKPEIFFTPETYTETINQITNLELEIKDVRDLADYLYLKKNLAELSGSKYQKKRNHINQFIKKHPDVQFQLLTTDFKDDVLKIENQWLHQIQEFTDEKPSEDLLIEKQLIETALNNFEELKLTGGLVYCEDQPVAMCLASKINNTVTDIHFEKAISPFAKDGAYAFINQRFASTISTEYINREEDLGLENLRKAKESYYPDILLKKNNILIH